jgi:acid phosphatase
MLSEDGNPACSDTTNSTPINEHIIFTPLDEPTSLPDANYYQETDQLLEEQYHPILSPERHQFDSSQALNCVHGTNTPGYLAYIMNQFLVYRITIPALLSLVGLVNFVYAYNFPFKSRAPDFDINNVPGTNGGGEFGLNSYSYCQAAYPDVAKYVPPTPTAKLTHVQMVIRHGDRSPVTAVLPNELVNWRCDDMVEVSHTDGRLVGVDQEKGPNVADYSTRIHIPDKKPYKNVIWAKGTCMLGQLTSKGAHQHMELGASLRSIYVDKLRFLPPTLTNDDLTWNGKPGGNVYFRATDFWRTKQSAASLLTGLWPKKDGRANDVAALPIIVYPTEMETMYGQMKGQCPRLNQIEDAMRKKRQYQKVFQRHQPLRTRLERILSTDKMKQFKNTWVKYMDPIYARVCHKFDLPCRGECVTVRDALELNQSVNEEIAMLRGSLSDSAEYNRLSLGYFMGELHDRLLNAVNGFSLISEGNSRGSASVQPSKFELFSGHDDTIYGLIGILMSKDLRWPPYASNLIFELWEDKKPNVRPHSVENYLVRILYNGRPLPTDWCNFNACPLKTYLDHVEKYIVRDLDTACRAH